MRRGIPATPRMCMVKKARLNPINMTQKLILPRRLIHHAPGHLWAASNRSAAKTGNMLAPTST